jgi:hypothetical protein
LSKHPQITKPTPAFAHFCPSCQPNHPTKQPHAPFLARTGPFALLTTLSATLGVAASATGLAILSVKAARGAFAEDGLADRAARLRANKAVVTELRAGPAVAVLGAALATITLSDTGSRGAGVPPGSCVTGRGSGSAGARRWGFFFFFFLCVRCFFFSQICK